MMQYFCRRLKFIAIAIAPILLAACARPHVGDGSQDAADERRSPVEVSIRHIVHDTARPAYVTRDADGTSLWKLTRTFYERREFAPAWIEDGSPTSHITGLLRAIQSADREGLDPELYSASLLNQRNTEASSGFLTQKGFDLKEAGAIDIWLTWLYMSFASDLADGIADLARADPAWKIERTRFDPVSQLQRALADNRVAESLLQMAPANPDYLALRRVLAEYREQAAHGGWPRVPANARIKPGESSPFVPALAARLASSRDLTTTEPPLDQPSRYGSELQDAVKHFQRRHGLTDDGVVGRAVVAELNVPIETRIRQIELNMERWRWLPRDLGDPHIVVNIPEMQLDVWDHGSTPVSMRVVVGKRHAHTDLQRPDDVQCPGAVLECP